MKPQHQDHHAAERDVSRVEIAEAILETKYERDQQPQQYQADDDWPLRHGPGDSECIAEPKIFRQSLADVFAEIIREYA